MKSRPRRCVNMSRRPPATAGGCRMRRTRCAQLFSPICSKFAPSCSQAAAVRATPSASALPPSPARPSAAESRATGRHICRFRPIAHRRPTGFRFFRAPQKVGSTKRRNRKPNAPPKTSAARGRWEKSGCARAARALNFTPPFTWPPPFKTA